MATRMTPAERLQQRMLELATRQTNQEIVQASLEGLIPQPPPKTRGQEQSETLKARDDFIDNIKKLETDGTLRPKSVGEAIGLFLPSEYAPFNKKFSNFRDKISALNGISIGELKNLFKQYSQTVDAKILSDSYFKEGLSDEDLFKLQSVSPQIASLLATLNAKAFNELQEVEAKSDFPPADIPMLQKLYYPIQLATIKLALNDPDSKRSPKSIGDQFIGENDVDRVRAYDKQASSTIGNIIKKGSKSPIIQSYLMGNSTASDVSNAFLKLSYDELLDRLLTVKSAPPVAPPAPQRGKAPALRMGKRFSGKVPQAPPQLGLAPALRQGGQDDLKVLDEDKDDDEATDVVREMKEGRPKKTYKMVKRFSGKVPQAPPLPTEGDEPVQLKKAVLVAPKRRPPPRRVERIIRDDDDGQREEKIVRDEEKEADLALQRAKAESTNVKKLAKQFDIKSSIPTVDRYRIKKDGIDKLYEKYSNLIATDTATQADVRDFNFITKFLESDDKNDASKMFKFAIDQSKKAIKSGNLSKVDVEIIDGLAKIIDLMKKTPLRR